MKCPRCQHESPSDADFCPECGAKLDVVCAACGTTNAPTHKFCKKCGQALGAGASHGQVGVPSTAPSSYTPKHLAEKILTSKAALEGERKQVTVLFADLKGSMELLADRDPEEARKILDPVLEHMMEAVHRYEGTVNQVMGDGIMALFGAPLAHEDHAVRACYAALRMQESIKRYAQEAHRTHRVNVHMRVGINSGEVVVRAIGNDLHMDYTAVGQTTHLAPRMEQLVSPGNILLTPATLGLVEGYVEVKSLGNLPVKGLASAVKVYELIGAGPARTRLQAAAPRGLTRFVGRDAELEQLRRAQELASAGYGQVVAVAGEAGVGKSRLLYEFTHSSRMRGWLVLETALVSYGKATSYLPVIDLLKSYFEIQGREDLSECREKVTDKLRTLDESLKDTLPALLALLDVPVQDAAWRMLAPSERRQQTLDGVKRLLLREARERPLLVIVEDLHWIDSETQALLDGLVDSLASARLLLIVNYRPEYQHDWGGKSFYNHLRLETLPAESAEGLLDTLLGEQLGLSPLKESLLKIRNPFFLEETIRTLVETEVLAGERGQYRLTRPIQAIAVPATVQAMLAARIDRLPPEGKHLLQMASVVGRDVPLSLLQAISELPDNVLRLGLDRLQAADFMYETDLFPDLQYSFKHALTHEVAYGSLLKERRRSAHARIVDAIETLQHDRLGDQIERLAYHAVQGDLREKAGQYLRQAGAKAAARSVLHDARGCFEQALQILEALPESSATLEQAYETCIDLRSALNLLGEAPRELECLRKAEALADRMNDDRRRGRVCAFATATLTLLGKVDEALASGGHALEIARVTGDLRLRIITTCYLEQTHYFQGDYGRVVALATENLAALPDDWVYEYLGLPSPASVWDRLYLILSLTALGRFAEAAEYAGEALRLAESTRHAFTIGWAYLVASIFEASKGDWLKARARIEQTITVVRSGHIGMLLPTAVAWGAHIRARVGEANEALDHLQEGEQLLERLKTSGPSPLSAWTSLMLSAACLVLGRLDRARSLAEDVGEFFAGSPIAPFGLLLRGEIATHPERFNASQGEAHYSQALATAEARGMRPLVAHCHLGLGKLSRRTGKREQAQEHLTTATTMYREMGMRFWLEQAEQEVKELL